MATELPVHTARDNPTADARLAVIARRRGRYEASKGPFVVEEIPQNNSSIRFHQLDTEVNVGVATNVTAAEIGRIREHLADVTTESAAKEAFARAIREIKNSLGK